jgi:nicotinate phosphoribosyltransferase
MSKEGIIKSLLDNDLYKFTMMQAVFHQFSNINVKYELVCRTPNTFFTEEMFCDIQQEIQNYCNLSFTHDDIHYLSSIRFFKNDFLDFLIDFKPKTKYINLQYDSNSQMIKLNINGSWLQTILFEVPILAIINEVYYKHTFKIDLEIEYNRYKILELMNANKDIKIADF